MPSAHAITLVGAFGQKLRGSWFRETRGGPAPPAKKRRVPRNTRWTYGQKTASSAMNSRATLSLNR
jgi:hypothetical protein